MRNDTFIIAKDGLKCIAATAALVIFMMIIDADLLTFVASVLFLLTLWVYRNPERVLPHVQEKSIVSVCDGTVKSIETSEDEEGNVRYNITVKSSFLDTSILRVPFACKVQESTVVSGARLSVTSPLAERLNEKSLVLFGTGEEQVVVLHTLHLASVGIKNYLHEDREVLQGSRYGLMVKGETMIALPPESRVAIKVGQKVRAGETLIGYFS